MKRALVKNQLLELNRNPSKLLSFLGFKNHLNSISKIPASEVPLSLSRPKKWWHLSLNDAISGVFFLGQPERTGNSKPELSLQKCRWWVHARGSGSWKQRNTPRNAAAGTAMGHRMGHGHGCGHPTSRFLLKSKSLGKKQQQNELFLKKKTEDSRIWKRMWNLSKTLRGKC